MTLSKYTRTSPQNRVADIKNNSCKFLIDGDRNCLCFLGTNHKLLKTFTYYGAQKHNPKLLLKGVNRLTICRSEALCFLQNVGNKLPVQSKAILAI